MKNPIMQGMIGMMMPDKKPLSAKTNAETVKRLMKDWNLGPELASPDPTANKEYWTKLAEAWDVEVPVARRQLCANCEYFNDTPAKLEYMDVVPYGPMDADGGGRGYCTKFDFICHNLRTCQAWEERPYMESYE